MRKRVYLAGPIAGLDYEVATDWRDKAAEMLAEHNIVGVSPMRDKMQHYEERNLTDADRAVGSDRGVTSRDRFDVSSCDMVLMNLLGAKRGSLGSCVEFGWADILGKGIVTIMEAEGNPHDHKMLRDIMSYRVETLESGIAVIVSVLGPYTI